MIWGRVWSIPSAVLLFLIFFQPDFRYLLQGVILHQESSTSENETCPTIPPKHYVYVAENYQLKFI